MRPTVAVTCRCIRPDARESACAPRPRGRPAYAPRRSRGPRPAAAPEHDDGAAMLLRSEPAPLQLDEQAGGLEGPARRLHAAGVGTARRAGPDAVARAQPPLERERLRGHD